MSHRYFPFHALGFRCNPFRAVTDEEWTAVAVLPESVADVLENGLTHLQILGAMGCGKTTTLLGLAGRFKREGSRVAYEYLPEGQSRFHTNVHDLDVFLLDEAQRLSVRQRSRLLANAGKQQLVLSSHEDLTASFERRSLPLKTVRLDAMTSTHLRTTLEKRLNYFALSGESSVTFTSDAVHYLRETYGSDLRAMQHFLYEVFQRLQQTGEITMEMLTDTATSQTADCDAG
jgi:replication-associated recombination protein RarA